jgi:hypothetical protein
MTKILKVFAITVALAVGVIGVSAMAPLVEAGQKMN